MKLQDKKYTQRVLHVFRKLGLINLPDYMRFLIGVFKSRKQNREFLNQHPNFTAPSLWRMYEAYSHCNYSNYFRMGEDTARFIAAKCMEYVENRPISVMEWGCGPGRVIRHIPALLGDRADHVVGIDYNNESINYCKQAISGVKFHLNQLKPPCSLNDSSFDAIYAYSVFTHLSKEMHSAWITEIQRLLKSGGIFIATFHGKNFKHKLLDTETAQFDKGRLVVRSGAKEGSHMYSAYHPEEYLRSELFVDFDVLETINEVPGVTEQETWIVRVKD